MPKSTSLSAAEVNTSIVKALQALAKVGASSKGDHFDNTVRETFREYLRPHVTVILNDDPASVWRMSPQYEKWRQLCQDGKNPENHTGEFPAFPALTGVSDSCSTVYLIDKPNGNNAWPDLLIVFGNTAIPVEVKSSRKDEITWNGGMPRSQGLYIFNCYGLHKTTFFLGRYVLDNEECKGLKELSREASRCNQKVGERWKFYARAMYESSQRFFADLTLVNIRDRLQQRLLDISAHPTGDLKDMELSHEKELRLLRQVDEVESTIHDAKNNRRLAESGVVSYISALNWVQEKEAVSAPAVDLEGCEVSEEAPLFS